MSAVTSSPLLPPPDPRSIDALRVDLAEFTADGIAERLGPVAAGAIGREDPVPARRVVKGERDPLATLIRCFVLGDPVEADDLAAALPTLGLDAARRAQLVSADGTRALVELSPHGDEGHDWVIASDLSEVATGGPLAADHVLGVGGASRTLASWTPRPRVRRALDLGTGCGVQALHLSGHAESVVASDISARALAFARFNAALAGQEWELREGSMLDPVEGERFDLVVSNPPFVITPRTGDLPLYEYRDGGRSGDAIVAELVTGLGAHLAPGGIAQLLGNWEVRRGEEWRDRVGAWCDASGLDAWVIQREDQDPAEYASTWARDIGYSVGSSAYEVMMNAWLDDFAARGVERIGFGVVTLHRPASERAPWRDLTEHYGPVASPMGPSVLASLQARVWIAEHDDDALLDTRWTSTSDVTEERHSTPGSADPQLILLRQGGGLGQVVRLDSDGAALVSVMDGDLTARQALTAIAALSERPAGEVITAALPLLRGLVGDGLLA
ncbi:methyltransferase [Janibacter sp. GXQ6167]|uniref:DUF7059 domain-containing protein n=1 Tax=Janibacter sp. GXQ6167 TaxID=3240791 RepID=UPI003525E642